MKKVLFISLGIIIIAAISATIYYLSVPKVEPVYFQIIREEQQLDNEMIKWIENKEQNKGIHIYSLDTANPYEMLLYYNENAGKNLYINPKLDAKIINGILKININDESATDDSYVKDRLTAYFIIKAKPKDIEIYYNKQKQNIDIESGTNKISR